MRHRFPQCTKESSQTLDRARALVRISRNEGIRQGYLPEMFEIRPITLAPIIDQLANALRDLEEQNFALVFLALRKMRDNLGSW